MHALFSIPLKPILQSICEGSVSPYRLSQFLRLCIRFSVAYLKMQSAKGYRILNGPGREEPEWESVAVQALATLFRRDGNGRWLQLESYFAPMLETDPDDADCLAAVRRLVMNKTRQGLAELFHERDPEGARIRRNIQLAVEGAPRIRLEYDLRGAVILFGADISRPAFWLDGEFSRLVSEVMKPMDTMPALLQKLLAHLGREERLPAAGALADLARAVKCHHLHHTRQDAGEHDRPENRWIGEMEADRVREVVEKARLELDEKIDSDYMAAGKLTDIQGAALKQALMLLARDWCAGDPAGPFFDYFRESVPQLDETGYRQTLRTRFEYLVKLFRQKISEKLPEFSADEFLAGSRHE